MRLPWAQALGFAERTGALLRGLDPALAEELDGIAEGAGVDPREILVINIRTGLTRMVEVAAPRTTNAPPSRSSAASPPKATR